jgi:hypothetical protein
VVVALLASCAKPITLAVFRGDLPYGREGRSADGLVISRGQTALLTALAKDVYGRPTWTNPTWRATVPDVVGFTSGHGAKVGLLGLKRGETDLIVQAGAARCVVRHVRVR